MMRFLYTSLLYLYFAGVSVAAFFSDKARLWVRGRKHLPGNCTQIAGSGSQKIIWFHCASLGEFEQGRPVMEQVRKDHPGMRMLLTFYSPSGYEVRKDYTGADHVCYLPLDTPLRMKQFIDYWNPALLVTVKYEYWYNLIQILYQRDIPVIIISAILRPGQHFFRFYGKWFRKHLRMINHFFVQDKPTAILLNRIGIKQLTISGDTRFDRVFAIRNNPVSFPLIKDFTSQETVIIAGSTWEKDEVLLASAFHDKATTFKLIIAPHQIKETNLLRIEALFGHQCARISQCKDVIPSDIQVLIIDSIGVLSHIYQYGRLAYIGGGFGVGIHNILEAATFGLPVIFGPNYYKFNEARELVYEKGAFPVSNEAELKNILNALINNPGKLDDCAAICHNYVKERTGATQIITRYLKNKLV